MTDTTKDRVKISRYREKMMRQENLNKDVKATHKLIVCDTFDFEDYSVWVHEGEDVETIRRKYDGRNMQRVHEVIVLDPPSKCRCWEHS